MSLVASGCLSWTELDKKPHDKQKSKLIKTKFLHLSFKM